jgi:hypothetical protein
MPQASTYLEISNNSTSILRSCPKKYYWTYVEGLKPLRKSQSLLLGSVLQDSFNLFYNGSTKVEVHQYINKIMEEEILKVSPTEEEDFWVTKYTLTGMWLGYPFRRDSFTNIKPEMELTVDLMPGVKIVLRIDGLVTDDMNRLWIRELKTTSQSFQQFETKSRTSSQGTLYIWAVRKAGYDVHGIIYDYIKKPLLRKNVKDDIHSYGARILNDYSDRPEYYYKRHSAYRNVVELKLFEHDLCIWAREILRRYSSNEWPRNQDNCWNYNSECPFLKICYSEEPDKLTIELFYEREINNKFKEVQDAQGNQSSQDV